jgi:cell division initiation protein
MAIRPVDIRRKEFKNSLRGYDANQVDDFLDEVADEFERVFAENQRMSDEMTVLHERLQQFEELEASIREALVHAQQVAGDLRRNAGKEAELIVREAKEQAHRILADSSGRVERVQESYEVLRQAKQDFSNDFRHLLKTYLAVMDQADVASAREIEASLRERLDLESVATAHEAAETRRLEGRDEPAIAQKTGGAERDAGDAADTGRIEVVATPSGDAAGTETGGPGPAPEAEEPEVEPSSSQHRPSRPEDAPGDATDPGPGAAREVEREEPMPAGENRTADEFFNEGGARSEETEERKIFRASRFLRRRG